MRLVGLVGFPDDRPERERSVGTVVALVVVVRRRARPFGGRDGAGCLCGHGGGWVGSLGRDGRARAAQQFGHELLVDLDVGARYAPQGPRERARKRGTDGGREAVERVGGDFGQPQERKQLVELAALYAGRQRIVRRAADLRDVGVALNATLDDSECKIGGVAGRGRERRLRIGAGGRQDGAEFVRLTQHVEVVQLPDHALVLNRRKTESGVPSERPEVGGGVGAALYVRHGVGESGMQGGRHADDGWLVEHKELVADAEARGAPDVAGVGDGEGGRHAAFTAGVIEGLTRADLLVLQPQSRGIPRAVHSRAHARPTRSGHAATRATL